MKFYAITAWTRAVAILLAALVVTSIHAPAAETPTAFAGEKSAWHGFDRYDFFMDEEKLTLAPGKADEKREGQRRCIVVVPKEPAPGNPWSWRGCYWDHEPQTEIELLKRGFHIAYITAIATQGP